MYQHPQYVGLLVYEGLKGEKAHAGAFHRPGPGRTLLKECGAAYGSGYSNISTARKVNSNPWNVEQGRAGNVVYRDSDTKCSALKVSPDKMPGAANALFGSGPWIAQCPYADPQQVYWMPPKDGWNKRPEDLSASKPYKPPPATFLPPEQDSGVPPVGTVLLPGPGAEPEEPVLNGSKKWWVLGGIAAFIAAAGLGYYAWRKKK